MYSQDVTIHINAEKAARLKELDITVHGGWLDEGVQPVNSQKIISITLEETDIEKLSLSVRQEDIKTVKNSLQWRKTLRDGMPYWQIAKQMADAILIIRDTEKTVEEKMQSARLLHSDLLLCLGEPELDNLTDIYADRPHSGILGFDPMAVSYFVKQLLLEYPEPGPLSDLDEDQALLFDAYDNHSIDALEAVLVELAEGQLKTPKGAVLIKTEDKDSIKFDLKIENQWIASYRPIKDYYTVTFNDDKELISRLISSVPDLVTAINVCKAEEDET